MPLSRMRSSVSIRSFLSIVTAADLIQRSLSERRWLCAGRAAGALSCALAGLAPGLRKFGLRSSLLCHDWFFTTCDVRHRSAAVFAVSLHFSRIALLVNNVFGGNFVYGSWSFQEN